MTRYDFAVFQDGGFEPWPSPTGEWVKFSEVEALLAELNLLRSASTEAREYQGDPMVGNFHCACVFYRSGEFEEATLVSVCAYHAKPGATPPSPLAPSQDKRCDLCGRTTPYGIIPEEDCKYVLCPIRLEPQSSRLEGK